jgi:hypothetical protein
VSPQLVQIDAALDDGEIESRNARALAYKMVRSGAAVGVAFAAACELDHREILTLMDATDDPGDYPMPRWMKRAYFETEGQS